MRRLRFDPWSDDGSDNSQRSSPSNTAWIMLWAAYVDPADDPRTGQPAVTLGRDPARTVAAIQLDEALRGLREELPDNKTRLRPAGGTVLLEEAAYELLTQLWDAKKALFPPAMARFRKTTDDWLQSNVEHVDPKDLQREESD